MSAKRNKSSPRTTKKKSSGKKAGKPPRKDKDARVIPKPQKKNVAKASKAMTPDERAVILKDLRKKERGGVG